MNMQQIRYFIALCQEQNFTRAARQCGVAQPSLTRAIKLLEEELGGRLFHRTRRRTSLSALGCAVHPHLQQIAQAATDARRAAEKAAAV
jgi:DNA-binding transcriptional LysR family regulator